MGGNLQRSDDDGCGDRSARPSQHRPRTEYPKLSNGTSPKGANFSHKPRRTPRGGHSLMVAGPPLRPFGASLRPSHHQRHKGEEERSSNDNREFWLSLTG